MGCGVTILKKILVLTFDDQYLKPIGKIIANKDFEINENTNFINHKFKQKIYFLHFYQINKNGHGCIIFQELMEQLLYTKEMKLKIILMN